MDLDAIIDNLKKQVLLKELDVKELTGKARELLLEEPNVVRVTSPVTV